MSKKIVGGALLICVALAGVGLFLMLSEEPAAPDTKEPEPPIVVDSDLSEPPPSVESLISQGTLSEPKQPTTSEAPTEPQEDEETELLIRKPLAFERRVVVGDMMNGGATDQLLDGADFQALLESYQSSPDPAAVANTASYQAAVAEKIIDAGFDGLASIEDIGCGVVSCVAVVVGEDDLISAFVLPGPRAADFPTYGILQHSEPVGDNVSEHRIIFGITPEMNRITQPADESIFPIYRPILDPEEEPKPPTPHRPKI